MDSNRELEAAITRVELVRFFSDSSIVARDIGASHLCVGASVLSDLLVYPPRSWCPVGWAFFFSSL